MDPRLVPSAYRGMPAGQPPDSKPVGYSHYEPPRDPERVFPFLLKQILDFIAQKVEGPPQWAPPCLVPSFSPTRLAAAILKPPSNPMGATPGGPISIWTRFDHDLPGGRMLFKKGPIIRHPIVPLGRFHFQSVSQAAISKFSMVPVGFPIGCGLNDSSLALSSPGNTVQ